MTLKDEVTNVLRDYPATRNDDALLALYVWWRRMPDAFRQIDNKWYIEVSSITSGLPREDNIKRIRAFIQNEERQYLPTDLYVLAKRAKRADNWKEEIIYGS